MVGPTATSPLRLRVTKLFEYLKAYVDLKFPPVRNIATQPGVLWLDELPDHPSIDIRFGVSEANESEADSDFVARVRRPVTTDCPQPPAEVYEWLDASWRDPYAEPSIRSTVNRVNESGGTALEAFDASRTRVRALEGWMAVRSTWAANERPARESMRVFRKIYEWYGTLEREGERIELLVGDGLLQCSHPDGNFDHPILLQKVELAFEPQRQPPEFIFRKREQPPELYQEFLRAIPGAHLGQLGQCADELKAGEFSPLGAEDTSGFLRRLIQGLFPPSGTFGTAEAMKSSDTIRPTISRRAAFFMRPRRTGPSNIFDLVLQDIAVREEFSPALTQMLGLFTKAASPDTTPPLELVSSHCNEDAEVLFGKPANREQLDIARQLKRRDCVVVQGPPGTGKTHTIANLIGDLLSQGKRVLVTAHTSKALKVLRQKVVAEIQPLCVSVLQNDRSSQEDLQQAVRKIHVRLSDDALLVEREVSRLRTERENLLAVLSGARRELLVARQDETRDLVFGGVAVRPIVAARRVKAGASEHGWIPSPVNPGDALPLSPAEIAELYHTNARISREDEREIGTFRPALNGFPTPQEFRGAIEKAAELTKSDLRFREELWSGGVHPDDPAVFDGMLEHANNAIKFLRDIAPWQLDAVQAGRDGDHACEVWRSLIQLIETSWNESHACHTLVIEQGPAIADERPPHELIALIDEIVAHVKAGRSFGLVVKLTKGHWFEFQKHATISGRPMDLANVGHLAALRALLRLEQLRIDLRQRWERQMSPKGALSVSELGDRPEQVCRQFVLRIEQSLNWHRGQWLVLESKFHQVGFNYASFLANCSPESGDHADLNRLRRAVVEQLEPILAARAAFLHHAVIVRQISAWQKAAQQTETPEATATQQLRRSILEGNAGHYELAHAELWRLKSLESDLKERRALLAKLKLSAPAWATAVENRVEPHAKGEPPGAPAAAWEWRQLHDELERRASVSLSLLQERTEELGKTLLELTSRLIDKQTWLCQIHQTTPEQRQALGAYAALRNKLSKTGTGVRDPEIRAAARREMAIAKDAVPVWIMPLAEAAETFDPRKTRFDVVIIDEASQCDPTSLFALYMAKQTIVVGDDEQVTPMAIGVQSSEVSNLIRVFLDGVPHRELYDGETSIYELAQIAFGSAIRLTEHFRCAPDIIAFSNALSYKGEIRPLREAAAVPLTPHLVAHRVANGFAGPDNVNAAEAETIASLICAAIERPEFIANDQGQPTTFGVVSLLGDKQALQIDTILRQRLDPVKYRRHQILCGDSAQFQGDERDVMFVSVVDGPAPSPPLSLRQEGPKKMFKKRYNVAASRARNQMWVVHSLNHETDLQPADYRRRLIEHAIDPKAWQRELDLRIGKIDPNSTAFEGPVLRRLIERGYNVVPQYQVGAYRIDLVVVGRKNRLAIECDGDKYHGPERLAEDISRQAILERLGWKFCRIRGSLFFRDEERALAPIFQRLTELGIEPDLTSQATQAQESETVQGVVRDADALRKRWRANGYDTEDTEISRLPVAPIKFPAVSSPRRGADAKPVDTTHLHSPGGNRPLRRIRVLVTEGSLKQNLLPLAEHINAGTLAVGESLIIRTPSGALFKTDVVEQGKKLRARGEVAQFYRDAGVRGGDSVLLQETDSGRWSISKVSESDAQKIQPLSMPMRHGPATIRDILGR